MQTRYLALGPRFGQVLVAQVEGFASRRSFWTDFREFVMLGEAGDTNNSTSMLNYHGTDMDHIATSEKVYTSFVALGPRFGLVLVAQVKGFASRGLRSGRFFRFLRFWARLAI